MVLSSICCIRKYDPRQVKNTNARTKIKKDAKRRKHNYEFRVGSKKRTIQNDQKNKPEIEFHTQKTQLGSQE